MNRLLVDFNDIRDGVVRGFGEHLANAQIGDRILVHDGDVHDEKGELLTNECEADVIEVKESHYMPGRLLIRARIDWDTWF